MANNHFITYIYGIDSPGGNTEISASGGAANSFPSAGTHIYPTSTVRGNGQVTCVSIIELLPQGLNQVSTKYYSADTVAALNTLAT